MAKKFTVGADYGESCTVSYCFYLPLSLSHPTSKSTATNISNRNSSHNSYRQISMPIAIKVHGVSLRYRYACVANQTSLPKYNRKLTVIEDQLLFIILANQKSIDHVIWCVQYRHTHQYKGEFP